jgi:hypothetical protein
LPTKFQMKTARDAVFAAIFFIISMGYIVDAFRTQRRQYRKTSLGLSVKEEGNLLKFGSRIPMNVALPTNDIELAKQFLSKTEYIVESTWMKGKQTNMGKGTFLLQFLTLPIGFDTITPEIEVDFIYDAQDSCIRMKSGSWQLKGKEGVVKDSRFMQSFKIELEGVLTAVEGSTADGIIVDGWVRYGVKGEKPSIFKRAPAFILDNTIGFIQANVERFAYKEFTGRLLKAFRQFIVMDASSLQTSAGQLPSSTGAGAGAGAGVGVGVGVGGVSAGGRGGGDFTRSPPAPPIAARRAPPGPMRNLNARERVIEGPSAPVIRHQDAAATAARNNKHNNEGRPKAR